MQIERFAESPVGTLVPISGYDPRFNEEYTHWAYVPEPLPASVDLHSETWAVAVLRLHTPSGDCGKRVAAFRTRRSSASPRYGEKPSVHRRSKARTHRSRRCSKPKQSQKSHARRKYERSSTTSPRRITRLRHWATGHSASPCWLRCRTCWSEAHTANDPTQVDAAKPPSSSARRTLASRTRGFIPPPADDRLQAGVDAWIDWVNTPPKLPVVVECALSHYQFETLHPFSDGNGRIGRLSIVLELLLRGALEEPVLTVSPWLEERRDEYQDHLLRVSMTGDFDAWVRFFASAVLSRSEATIAQISALEEWKERTLEQLRTVRHRRGS